MGTVETLMVIGAAGGALYSVGGYLKNRRKGDKFSGWKLLGTAVTGAVSGLAKMVPILGDVLTSIGGVAVGKKVVKVIAQRRYDQ